jgi:hypothetical protein
MLQGLIVVLSHGPPLQPTNTEPVQGTAVTETFWSGSTG